MREATLERWTRDVREAIAVGSRIGERVVLIGTDIPQAPWYVVDADDKRRARLNCIHHLLGLIPYEDLTPEPIELPQREEGVGYVRPPLSDQTFVPEIYP